MEWRYDECRSALTVRGKRSELPSRELRALSSESWSTREPACTREHVLSRSTARHFTFRVSLGQETAADDHDDDDSTPWPVIESTLVTFPAVPADTESAVCVCAPTVPTVPASSSVVLRAISDNSADARTATAAAAKRSTVLVARRRSLSLLAARVQQRHTCTQASGRAAPHRQTQHYAPARLTVFSPFSTFSLSPSRQYSLPGTTCWSR